MSGFVYLWFDRKHRRFYIGSHWGSIDDRYVCSSRWMRKAYHRRPDDFKRRILAIITTSRHDLLVEEARWLRMIKRHEIKTRYYNIKRKGDNLWFAHPDDLLTVGQKISKALKGKKYGPKPERGASISAGKIAGHEKRRQENGAAVSEATRAKISASKRTANLKHTAAHKKRLSAKMRAARAANPDWDRQHDGVCVGCGTAFKGRETQTYCTPRCRHMYSERTRRARIA
jgi:hypothetical protein